MYPLYDYKKFAVLYVDDEEKSLKYFSRSFSDHFRILIAPNAAEGYRLLDEHKDDIGILMTDQRMPGETGVQLLEKARQLRPRILRILVTAYADHQAAVDAVNTGAIYKYITKPWEPEQLEMTLKRAMEFYLVQRERDQLLKEKLSVLHNIMITDRVVSLSLLAAGLGHHIRNSLVAIRTFLDLAPEKLQEEKVNFDQLRNPAFWTEFYSHVQRQLVRITELLADLGLAAEQREHRFENRVQLQQMLNNQVELMRNEISAKGIIIENNFSAELPLLIADEGKMARFFELLIKDELLNLPVGAKISFDGTAVNGPDGKGVLEVVIKDTGPGLANESVRSVFDPFFLRYDNPQDFGLNLMACFFIVYHHGGKIDVSSKEGEGTTFRITLPLNPADQSLVSTDAEYLPKMLFNENMWERLLAGTF